MTVDRSDFTPKPNSKPNPNPDPNPKATHTGAERRLCGNLTSAAHLLLVVRGAHQRPSGLRGAAVRAGRLLLDRMCVCACVRVWLGPTPTQRLTMTVNPPPNPNAQP